MSLPKSITDLMPLLDDSDIEDILLIYSEKAEPIPRVSKFAFDTMVDSYCFFHFRFYKSDIVKLVRLLQIPNSIVCDNGVKVNGVEAMCITLKRLSYPNR